MGYGFSSGFGMFDFIEVAFGIFFIIFFGIFLFLLAKRIGQWSRNNASPVLSVTAEVVAKRANTSHGHGVAGEIHTTSTTTYYATFQVESGDRLEFAVGSWEYGMLVEGDRGTLTFQGTRYKSFQRQ